MLRRRAEALSLMEKQANQKNAVSKMRPELIQRTAKLTLQGRIIAMYACSLSAIKKVRILFRLRARKRIIILFALALGLICSCGPKKHAKWFMKTTTGPGPRSGFSMAYDPVKEIVFLHGGFGPGKDADRKFRVLGPNQSDTWVWDGLSWEQVQKSHLTLMSHAMAYHKGLKTMVMFGGWGVTRTNQTWVWSGENWSKVSEMGPENRENHALVFDEKRGSIILFGGLTIKFRVGQIALGDTWEWNGSQWSQLHVKGPEPRWGHKMIYDEDRGVIVLFGGYDSLRYFNDTWIWEGKTATWSKVTPKNSPTERCNHAMSFDTRNRKVLLFAGKTGRDSPLNDLWEWDGSDWTPIRQEAPPKPRYGHAMVYGKKRQLTILFGGYDGEQYFRDTSELTY